jgi:hypothetical protein
MATLVHFAPLNKASKIKKNGLRKSKATHRAIGVYAAPCLGFAPTAVSDWRRAIKSEGKSTRRVAIIFEVSDDELVHCFENWGDNMERGNRELCPARSGAALARTQVGKNDGRFGGMEVVVPRGIKPTEIVEVVVASKKKNRAARRSQDRRLIAEMMND